MKNYLLYTQRLRGAKLLLVFGTLVGSSIAYGDVIYQQGFEGWNNGAGLWSTSTTASLGGPYSTVLGRFGTESARLRIRATAENTGWDGGGGNPGSNPFNIEVDHYDHDRVREHYPDSGGGGGFGGPIGDTIFDQPQLDLGNAVSEGNSPGEPMFGPGTYAIHFDLMLFDSWDGRWEPKGFDSFSMSVNGVTLFDEYLYSSAYGGGLNFREPDETPGVNAYDSRWEDSIYRDITVLVELSEGVDELDIVFSGITSQAIHDESWGLDNILVERVSGLRTTPGVPAPGTLVLLGGGLGVMGRRRR